MGLFNECCGIAFNALEGTYGWMAEVGALLLLVLLFNFIVKVVLKQIHKQLDASGRIWSDCFVTALYKPLSYFIWFFAFLRLFKLFYERTISLHPFPDIGELTLIGGVLATVWFVLRWKKNILAAMGQNDSKKEGLPEKRHLDVLDKLLTIFILFTAILILMDLLGLNINTLIAFGGIGGLAIAFASQEIISSFFGGLMIYLTHPFAVGDWIALPEKNVEGSVESIGWYMTAIRSLDKKLVYVPNAAFSKSVVVNPSRMSHRPFRELVGIRYTDKPQLKKIVHEIKEMLQFHPDIDQAMNIVVGLNGFGVSSLDIQIIAYTKETAGEGYSKVRQDLFIKILDIIHANGADLPFPTSTLEFATPIKLDSIPQKKLEDNLHE